MSKEKVKKVKEQIEELVDKAGADKEKLSEDFESFKDSAEDLFKTMAEAGLGLLNLAKERFEKTVSEVGDVTSFSKDDADSIINNFKGEAESVKGNVESKLKEVTSSLKDRFDMPSRKEFDKLKKKVKKMEKAIKDLDA